MSSDFLAQTSPMKSKDKIMSAHNLAKLKRSDEDEVADSLDSGITPPKLQSVSSFGAPNSGKLAVASPIKKFNSALKKKSLKSEPQTSERGRPRANQATIQEMLTKYDLEAVSDASTIKERSEMKAQDFEKEQQEHEPEKEETKEKS